MHQAQWSPEALSSCPVVGREKVQDLGAPRTPAPLCLCDHRLVTQLFWALVSSFVNWR